MRRHWRADFLPERLRRIGRSHWILEFLRKNLPDSHSDVVRAFADGDYVILHVRKVPRPGDLPIAIVDIFRLDKGKLVEHWDVSQQVPARIVSGNPTF